MAKKKSEVAAPASELPFVPSQIVMRSIEELAANPRNARIHPEEQLDALAESMKAYGFTIPVLVTPEGMIIAGHGRVEAAGRINLKEVPTIIADGWTPEQIRAYTIADNRLSETSRWDEALLALELGDLAELGADLKMTGFDEASLSRYLASQVDEAEPPEDFASYDEDIPVEHCCPKCGYTWSGGA